MTLKEARSGYHPVFKANKNWKKQRCVCQWEHCIELMPLLDEEKTLSIKNSLNCPIFGHICPDGIYGINNCEGELREERLIK